MTHPVVIFSIQNIFVEEKQGELIMRTRRTSTAAMKKKGQYPSDRETLQDSVELIFGSDPEKMKEMAAKIRTRFAQAAIAGAVGSVIFYYLLLNHHI